MCVRFAAFCGILSTFYLKQKRPQAEETSSGSDLKQDLAKIGVRFHVAVGFGDIPEGVAAVRSAGVRLS